MAIDRPRVLLLGLGWFPAQIGGLNRYFRALLENLPEARGVVVGPAPGADPRVAVASRHDAPLPVRLGWFWLAAGELAGESDVVDAHFALYALPCVLLGRLRRHPLIVHFQGPWADENVVHGDPSPWRRRARESLEKVVYRRAATVVTLSGAFRRVIVERYGVSPWRVVVQAPGVDLVRFSPGDRAAARKRLNVPPDIFVVSCVRRLVPRMGLSVLLEAWRGFPGLLLIAGAGGLRAELERQIEVRGLTDSVRLLGRVDDQTLVDLYRAADLNVVPTLAFEGFGLVVAEAAGCGTASVVTRVGGLPEAVSGLGQDLVVEPDDASALRGRFQSAADGERPGREDVRAWAERYGWDRVAAIHRGLYRRALEPSGATQRPKVVYIDHVARLSGGEIALQRLLLATSGSVDAHVILGEEGPLVDRLIAQGTSVEVLRMNPAARDLRKDDLRPGRKSAGAIPATALYVLRLAWRLRRLRPDVIHTNSLKAGVYGSLAARLAGIPVVWHVRDRIDLSYLPRSAVVLLQALIPLLAQFVVANSEATLRSLGRQSSRVGYAVVYAALQEPPAQHRTPRGRIGHGDSLRIGIVGRLAHWKGQHVFLDAFARAFPAGRHRAILVGSALFGEDDYADSLRRRAASLGIDDRVEFRGFRDDVMGELAEFDILVHASISPEPFGNVIIEGLAAGLPVLASAEGGPTEIITHDVDGLLYPAGDVGALATLLGQVAADEAQRARLGAAGLRRARDFDPAVLAEQLVRIYAVATSAPITRDSPSGCAPPQHL
jgi:glycosyltransferase involved in cell wall biosynthesis